MTFQQKEKTRKKRRNWCILVSTSKQPSCPSSIYVYTLAACLIFPSFCNSIEVANKSSQSPDVPFYKRWAEDSSKKGHNLAMIGRRGFFSWSLDLDLRTNGEGCAKRTVIDTKERIHSDSSYIRRRGFAVGTRTPQLTCHSAIFFLLSRFHSHFRFNFDFDFLSKSNWNIISILLLYRRLTFKTMILSWNNGTIYLYRLCILQNICPHLLKKYRKLPEVGMTFPSHLSNKYLHCQTFYF